MRDKKDFFSKDSSLILVELFQSLLLVNKRDQFFSWLQGSFQSLLPREILLCAVSRRNRSKLYFEKFSSARYFNEHNLQLVTDESDGIVTSLLECWNRNYKPVLIGNLLKVKETGSYLIPFELSSESLLKNELLNVIAHGVADNHVDVVSFFNFSSVKGELSSRQAYILELFVPHLHSALTRVLKDTGGLNKKTDVELS